MIPFSARRNLALWLPFLTADRWRSNQADAAVATEMPIAFIEKQRGAMRITAVSPAAAALGLSPGLMLADARAQLPDLVALPNDPGADARWLEQLADHCERYTPAVAIDPPDALVLDITGCAHLFGSEAALIADIKTQLTGVYLCIACARTPEAALALARHSAGDDADEASAVRRLPVAALRLDGTVETALCRAGLQRIGDLADRPTAPLSARFGAATTDALHRLLSRADSRITPRRPLPPLVATRRFADPIAQIDFAIDAIESLLVEAAIELDQRGCGGRRFAVRLFRSDGARVDLAVDTGRPTRDPAIVLRLLRERIDALADPIDPGFGFDMIRLAVPVLEPLGPQQLAITDDAADDAAIDALIDRLSTRLGRDRVYRFAPRDTHIPERASLALPAADRQPAAPWPTLVTGEPPLRPIHLLQPPQHITVIAAVPDGPPRRFQWQRTMHDIVAHEGPERIASEWWRTNKRVPTRDYYRVEDSDGRRFWIFRHGLYGHECADPAWYVHGLFA